MYLALGKPKRSRKKVKDKMVIGSLGQKSPLPNGENSGGGGYHFQLVYRIENIGTNLQVGFDKSAGWIRQICRLDSTNLQVGFDKSAGWIRQICRLDSGGFRFYPTLSEAGSETELRVGDLLEPSQERVKQEHMHLGGERLEGVAS